MMAVLLVGEGPAFGVYLLFDVTQFIAQPGGLLRYELTALRDRGLVAHQLRRPRAERLNLLGQVGLPLARLRRVELDPRNDLAHFVERFFGGSGGPGGLVLRGLAFRHRRGKARFARGDFIQSRLYLAEGLAGRAVI